MMKRALMVGAGVVNLVTAYFLSKEGYQLTIVDKASNPLNPCFWKKQGCTFGGENVRMFTYTEADNYNEKGSQLYSKMDGAFEQVIDDSGWLVRSKENLNENEQLWIEDFHSVSPEAATQFGEDIYKVNICSGALWQKWMQNAPELFEDVDILNDILRIYSDSVDFVAAQKLHRRLGSMTHAFSDKSALEAFPLFKYAYVNDMLGGCMMVKGFTLKVQDFCSKIICHLMKQGAEFKWETEFSGIERDAYGKVRGVFIDNELETFDNYVLSLGAYAGTTIKNTTTNNQLHGVLGVWLTIPNIYQELKYSMKIHKTGRVGEDTNVTLIRHNGKPVLVLGSGYGYTGNTIRNNVKNIELKGIFESLKHTAATYFPEAYDLVKSEIDETKKYCIRSWTPTGLGVFESIPTTQNGQLIITGGNNTGGFTQSPYIAEAVLQTIKGHEHALQKLFHPERMYTYAYNS